MRRAAVAAAGSLASAAAGPGVASAQPPAGRPFDDLVARGIAGAGPAGRRAPGMVGAIIRGDRLVGIAAAGFRRVGSPERVATTDRFHLGSCTKAMTATWIGMAIDAGRLRWDTTLAGAFPDLAGRIHPDYRGVTLDQLLAHRAGLPANVDWGAVPPAPSPYFQRRAVLASALAGRPASAPGSRFGYSNLGFVLAGLMAEEATATPWEVAIRRFVFDPLGMASAGFGPPGSARDVREPWGHRPVGGIPVPSRDDNPPVLGPAGTVHASVGDWARFAAFHLGDGTAGGRAILSPQTFRELHTPAPGQDYAGGWLVPRPRRGGGPVWEHAGSNTVWYAIIRLFPARRFGVLVACNAGAPIGDAACTAAADALQALEPPTRA